MQVDVSMTEIDHQTQSDNRHQRQPQQLQTQPSSLLQPHVFRRQPLLRSNLV